MSLSARHTDAPDPSAAPAAPPTGTDQPYLHDLVSCVRAPVLALSAADGQMRAGGVHGVFREDRRVLSRLVLRCDGAEPAPVAGHSIGAAAGRFVAVVRGAGDHEADPTVLVERLRELRGDGMVERICIASSARRPVRLDVELEVSADLARLGEVKAGRASARVPAVPVAGGLSWEQGPLRSSLRCRPEPDTVEAGDGLLRWTMRLGPGDRQEIEVTVAADVPLPGASFRAVDAAPWSRVEVTAADHRLHRLVDQSLDDLGGLLLADGDHPEDMFLAAGSPWFLTMFGRDALWAARMLLPLGTDLALGTLRALARRQGAEVDLATEEQPGKILHEVRGEPLEAGELFLPPLYYGTVDATPLWLSLLAEAWRWGADVDQVGALLPAAERALAWLHDHGDADGDGFLEYVDHTGHGLGNQGWKDSGDSVQWRDGRLADPPIALAEVQGYAYAAALDGAELLDAYGRPGADALREWAAGLRRRFREAFWVDDPEGPYPAIALDRHKRRVDSLTSNIGHLLGTGILDPEESAAVARRLAGADMDSGVGLRTLSARSPRFSPFSYHGGAVWPHDTAITAVGLAREGHADVAGSLMRGLLDAAPAFDYRLPELYAGEQARPGRRPLPYPAACRPQAWAAASVVALLGAAIGVRPHVPRGVVDLTPVRPAPFGALGLRGLRLGGERFDVEVGPDGAVTALHAAAGLDVRVR